MSEVYQDNWINLEEAAAYMGVTKDTLLRSDLYTLYDEGYITIDTNYRLDVSKRLHEDYGNGRDYYKYHGQKLLILPEWEEESPAKELLVWHNENVFLG